jgi:hypothetical protein
MSTNYYLDSPDNEGGHLGKSIGGSAFIAKAPEGIDSFDAWAAQMAGRQVYTEAGTEISAADLIELATRPRPPHQLPLPNEHRGEWMERGVLFVRDTFC